MRILVTSSMYSLRNFNALLNSRSMLLSNAARNAHHFCKILVVGGGTGGCSIAAKLSKKYNKAPQHIIVVEPAEAHYYQPMFTLIGGGMVPFESSKRPMKDVLPRAAQWVKDKVATFNPEQNTVKTSNGDTITYEFMIVSAGLNIFWDQIPGLKESVNRPDSQVCSIYGPNTVEQVFSKIKNTGKGKAIFTFPNTPVKCPGAPQKIAYIAEDYWNKHKQRKDIDVIYNTSLPVIFGVKKYADALWKVCSKRNIKVNVSTNLIEINAKKMEATFQSTLDPKKVRTEKYSFLHVTPRMGPHPVLKENSALTDGAGFLNVNPSTLQHQTFQNIFGLGDCTNSPNSKTMAAIASQSKVVYENILDQIENKPLRMAYNGYASCPLVTGYDKCILAEFDYKLQPLETFPVNQAKERYSMFLMKKYMLPYIYWNWMLKGNWNGPEVFRKCLHIFSTNKSKPSVNSAGQ